MAFRSVLRVASVAVALGGCALVDPVDQRYDTVSRSLAKARNEALFLNLVRASHDYPLSFTTIANVIPSLTNTTFLGMPTFVEGPLTPLSTTTSAVKSLASPGRDFLFSNSASNSTAVSTNFNVSTQETSQFYEGFLKPIDLRVLAYFIRQGYSRELLFWLFTDSVEITVRNHKFSTRFNPPHDFGCSERDPSKRCFADFVRIAVAAGLTVEERTRQMVSSEKGKAGAGGKPQTVVYPRFCFSDVLVQRAAIEMGTDRFAELQKEYFDTSLTSFSPRCSSKWDPGVDLDKWQPDTFEFTAGGIKFRITPRSAYGVFEFIGQLIKVQRDHPAGTGYVPPARPEEDVKRATLWTAQGEEDRDLINVVLNTGGPCFAHTWFYDGDYCVPESATNTKRIFGLLAQLVAIETAATDLSITPLVRVVQ